MYTSITKVLQEHQIPLGNCLAIAVDNTNANVGAHNSLSSRLTADNPSIYTSGCVCHIIHNAASCGASKLQVPYVALIDLAIFYCCTAYPLNSISSGAQLFLLLLFALTIPVTLESLSFLPPPISFHSFSTLSISPDRSYLHFITALH